MKINHTITNEILESTELLIQFAPNPQTIINTICIEHCLTKEFINRFQEYITIENFSTSYKLRKDIVDEFPELFNDALYIPNIGDNDDEDSNEGTPILFAAERYSLSLVVEYLDKFKELFSAEWFSELIRSATPDEFTDVPVLMALLGISSNCDQLIMLRTTDPEARDAMLLYITTEGNTPSAEVLKYCSKETKEEYIKGGSINELISAIAASNDLGWQIEKINEACNDHSLYTVFSGTNDAALAMLINKLPEDIICKLFSLKDLMPNIFSYKVMGFVLESKSFSEDQLIKYKDVFISSGNRAILKAYARNNDMITLSALL